MQTQADWLERIPKTELHLHLEGAIPLDALWTLAQKYGGDPQVPDIAALERKFVFRDFPHFIETWIWKNNFLREYEDFTFIAEAVARDLLRQNILTVEAFYSPSDFKRHGLEVGRITEAMRAGLDCVPQVQSHLIADLVRDELPSVSARTLAQVHEVRALGVIGVGLGGSEQSFPPEPFEPVFAEARRLGFHVTVHAGEVAGPASVWGALRSLKAERIGHGTHAVQDEALLDWLAETQVPVEMCPISNVRTGSVRSLQEHPIRRFFERGILVTVNTDDPKMFGNRLADEYRVLQSELGFTEAELRVLIDNAERAAWIQPANSASGFVA
jgi:adenosine deaminase